MRSHQRHGSEHVALRAQRPQRRWPSTRSHASTERSRNYPSCRRGRPVRRHRRRLGRAHASACAPVCPCAIHNRRPMLELAVDPTVVGVMRRREARSSHALPNLSLTQDVLKVATSKKGSEGHGSYILFQGT
ncbi:hypothetical protein SORBI_3009G094450 [Sorghum bicolor]|uniref:Uncharacterized protein n=1 Tax=Sorghum bicolor TaxID=4558 RepID=A0A1Z5R2H0_SORBI|nr:hypothetical protein SORBI_3009G094450 [Sorghum bicolor]